MTSRNTRPRDRWPATSSSPVCSRVLPVCQRCTVLYRFVIPTHAISQTGPRCRQPKLAFQPKKMNQNACFSLQKRTTDLFSKRFSISNNLLPLWRRWKLETRAARGNSSSAQQPVRVVPCNARVVYVARSGYQMCRHLLLISLGWLLRVASAVLPHVLVTFTSFSRFFFPRSVVPLSRSPALRTDRSDRSDRSRSR